MSITLEQLTKIMPACPGTRAGAYLALVNKAMAEASINTPLRQAMFLAQVAHESDQLKYVSEVWGPTLQQRRYDPPDPLASRLGNTAVGDGYKYRGAGPFQLTGKANYKKYGAKLGLDLENHPELAHEPANGFRIAAAYWIDHGLNELADAGNFKEITRRINGGYNGLEQREHLYEVAKRVLGC